MAVTDSREQRAPSESVSPERRDGPRMSVVFSVAFAFAGASIGIRRLHDNSFMWHLRTGRYILAHGIPHHDIYSYTAPGAKWVAQSWLAEVLYGVIWEHLGGSFALRIFGALVGAGVALWMYRIALRLSKDRIRALGLATITFLCVLEVWSERPLMLGLAAMLGVVFICEVPDHVLARRATYALPLIMWFWANVHGTFALGFLYLALHLAGRWIEGAPPTRGPEREVLRGTAIAAFVVFLNPYWIDLILFPLRLMGRSQVLSNVEEWQSPSLRDAGGKFFAALIVVMILVLARRRPGVRDLLVAVAFLLLGLYAVRNVGLTAVVVLPILARAVAVPEPKPDLRGSLNRMLVVLLAAAMVVGVVRAHREPNWDLHSFPVKAVEALDSRGLLGGHVLTTDSWGGYLIITEWPQQKVFYDDRYDMYPLAMNADYDKILRLEPGWNDVLSRHSVDVVMWPRDAAILEALALKPEWTKIYDDKLAVVYAKKSFLASRQH